ncbi:hypothetical protein CHRYSEOSP005_14960 [Chryseobacterium sp. Alg-005]|uniref:hypothetical protein n=1 Tax=Chryseobacterium sp. Alg-005 TaxID=3159516 RepID=UPI003555BDEA
MLYEKIDNAEMLKDFVERLNLLSLYDRYNLYNFVFEPHIFDITPKFYPRTRTVFYDIWRISVGKFNIYATIKTNTRLPIEKPGLNTGMYEEIFFHIHPGDQIGISQEAV